MSKKKYEFLLIYSKADELDRMKGLIEKGGYTVGAVATNLSEANHALDYYLPDGIVIDIRARDSYGGVATEFVVEHLRERNGWTCCPTVFLAQQDSPESYFVLNVSEGIKAGDYELLFEPVVSASLKFSIERAIQNSGYGELKEFRDELLKALIKHHADKGRVTDEVGEMFDCSYQTIYRRMKSLGFNRIFSGKLPTLPPRYRKG